MPAPIQITLNPEEDRTLTELRVAQAVPQRTRDRAGSDMEVVVRLKSLSTLHCSHE